MAELDKATGDSGPPEKGKITKRKVALPLLLVIGVVGGVLVYFIARRQSGASGAAAAAQQGLPYAVPSAQTAGNDASITGLMSLVGNLGQQMDANFAQLAKNTTPAPVVATNPAKGTLSFVDYAHSPAPWNPSGIPVWDTGKIGAEMMGTLPFQGQATVTGAPTLSGHRYFYPIAAPGGVTGWIQSDYVSGFQAPLLSSSGPTAAA
jgi:hypothetical protein